MIGPLVQVEDLTLIALSNRRKKRKSISNKKSLMKCYDNEMERDYKDYI